MTTLVCLIALAIGPATEEKPESPIVVDGVRVVWDEKQRHYIEEATGLKVMFFEFVGGDGKTVRKHLGRQRKLGVKEEQRNSELRLSGLLPLDIRQTLFIDHGNYRTFESITTDGSFRIITQFDSPQKRPWIWAVYKRTTDGAGYVLQNRNTEDSFESLRQRVRIEITNQPSRIR